MIDYTHLRHQCHKKLLVLGIITCNLPSCLQFCKSNTTKFTMKRKAGSLIYINWSGGRCTAGRGRGHYCSRANKSATPLNIKLNVARCSRLPQMMSCICRCQRSSSSDGGLLLATGLVYGPAPALCDLPPIVKKKPRPSAKREIQGGTSAVGASLI